MRHIVLTAAALSLVASAAFAQPPRSRARKIRPSNP